MTRDQPAPAGRARRNRARRASGVLAGVLVGVILAAAATPARVPRSWPCLQAQVRRAGGGWSAPLDFRRAMGRQEGVLEAKVGRIPPTGSGLRLARLDTPEVPDLIRCLAPRFGVDVDQALATGSSESHFDPQAVSPAGHSEVYQIDPGLFNAVAGTLGLGGASVFDAYANVYVAFDIVRREGWGRWACA